MKKILYPVLSIFAMLAFAACSKNSSAPANSAYVMMWNGCVGTTSVDVKVDGKSVPNGTGIPYCGNSGYQFATANAAVSINYSLSSLGTPLANSSATMLTGQHYTMFCGGLVTAPRLLFTIDSITATSNDRAKIRLVNLSPDTLAANASAGSQIFAAGISSIQASQFVEVPAGGSEIKAGDPSNISTVISLGTQSLSAGKMYTLILSGTRNGTGQSALRLTLIGNN